MAKQTNKNQLGKGIRALLSNMDEAPPKEKQQLVNDLNQSVNEIPMDWIEANPYQPRTEFEKESLEELADSIKIHGVIQPITVRKLNTEKFQIISGERRWRASKNAGLKTIPAYVRLADDQGMLEMALVENVQRKDLNALEVAVSLKRLMTECELTHEQLSDRIGKQRSTVSNYIRLLKLPPEIQDAIRHDQISMGHARALAGINDLPLQLTVYKVLKKKDLSVRALEDLIRTYSSAPKSKPSTSSTKDPEIVKIEQSLKEVFGSKVAIQQSVKGSGKVEIHFSSTKHLNYILDILDDIE